MKYLSNTPMTHGVVHVVSLHGYPHLKHLIPDDEPEGTAHIDHVFEWLSDNNHELASSETPDDWNKRLAPGADNALIGALIYLHLPPARDRLLAVTLADRFNDGNILIRHTFTAKDAADSFRREDDILVAPRKALVMLAYRLENPGLVMEENIRSDHKNANVLTLTGMANLSSSQLEDSGLNPLDHRLIALPGTEGELWLSSLPSRNKKSFAENIRSIVEQAAKDPLHPAVSAVNDWIRAEKLELKTHGKIYGHARNHHLYPLNHHAPTHNSGPV